MNYSLQLNPVRKKKEVIYLLYKDPLMVIYQSEDLNTENITYTITEEELPLQIQQTHQSAILGELAGMTTEIIDMLNSDFLASVINLKEAIAIGALLITTAKKAIEKGKKVKLSDKAIGYVATTENQEVIVGNKEFLGTVGPYYIQDPNTTLDQLTNINISGLDRVSGVLIAFQFKEGNRIRITWEIYNNEMKKVLYWSTSHRADEQSPFLKSKL